MSDIQTGVTFVDGQEVNAAVLNNAINNATILAAFYSGKTPSTPAAGDLLVFFQTATGTLKSSLVSSLVPISSISLNMPVEFDVSGSPLTSNGAITVEKDNQIANRHYLGPASGGPAQPTFRGVVPADLAMASAGLAGTDIDWSSTLNFATTLSANRTFTFSNTLEGLPIKIILVQGGAGGFTATWPAGIKWAGGAAPTLTVTAGHADLIMFDKIGGTIYGRYSLNHF
jgi:hypothetical protein